MCRSRILWRLFAAYSTLIAASLGLLGWILLARIENHLRNEIEHNLNMKTLLVRQLVVQQNQEEWPSQLRRLAEETGIRMRLIAADGTVVADSTDDPQEMENHPDRSEVQQAAGAADGKGIATRFSGTVQEPLMYVTLRQDSGPVRYVRLALPLSVMAAEIAWLRGIVWTAAAITLG